MFVFIFETFTYFFILSHFLFFNASLFFTSLLWLCFFFIFYYLFFPFNIPLFHNIPILCQFYYSFNFISRFSPFRIKAMIILFWFFNRWLDILWRRLCRLTYWRWWLWWGATLWFFWRTSNGKKSLSRSNVWIIKTISVYVLYFYLKVALLMSFLVQLFPIQLVVTAFWRNIIVFEINIKIFKTIFLVSLSIVPLLILN